MKVVDGELPELGEDGNDDGDQEVRCVADDVVVAELPVVRAPVRHGCCILENRRGERG